MKVLRITVKGLPLFKQELDIILYAQQRVSEDDKTTLFQLSSNPGIYMHTANAFIGINASGKTSILKVIELAFALLRNEPINHAASRGILGTAGNAVFRIYFYDADKNVCCLETEITSRKTKLGEAVYSIVNETLWKKPMSSVKSKKYLTDFSGMPPVSVRNENEMYLSDDVSFIIAHNKRAKDTLELHSLLSYTHMNVLPFSENIPLEVIAFLDPTIEKLCFEKDENKALIHLKFTEEDELILNDAADLEQMDTAVRYVARRQSGGVQSLFSAEGTEKAYRRKECAHRGVGPARAGQRGAPFRSRRIEARKKIRQRRGADHSSLRSAGRHRRFTQIHKACAHREQSEHL